MKNTLYYLVISMLLLTSCEKVIDLDLKVNTPKLVIEGNINDGVAPYFVTLSKTVAFTESSVYPPVTDAIVVISDDAGNTDILTHIGDGKYKTNSIIGTQGRTYSLKVTAEDKIYEATSKMPIKVPLDMLKVLSITFGTEIDNVIVPIYLDPIAIGNSYRFVPSINGKTDKSYLQWNDNTNNGLVNQRPLRSDDNEMEKGDSVSIEMQCIDNNIYQYYFTLGEMVGGGLGGGTTPSNPPNNITNGALGIFSAYTSETKSIVIP